MAERQIIHEADTPPIQPFIRAVIIAAFVHGLILWRLSHVPPTDKSAVILPPILGPSISVELIDAPPSAANTAIDLEPHPKPEAEPKPAPVPETAPELESEPETDPETKPETEPNSEPKPNAAPTPNPAPPNDRPAVILSPSPAPAPADAGHEDAPQSYVPSRWALEPALSKKRLSGIFGGGFEQDINCIRSLSEDCTSLRKDVFADYQLSQQELIWTESFAHSGLTNPALHGLSEREIRKRLGVPIAGDNGFVILPGIAIDGNLWDTLHGVNKQCPVLRGVRRCPPLKPKADDKRFHIPKKNTP